MPCLPQREGSHHTTVHLEALRRLSGMLLTYDTAHEPDRVRVGFLGPDVEAHVLEAVDRLREVRFFF